MYPDEDEPQVDITKLRYVLYARKSTDDPKRQIRSINDQIDECKLLAERSGMRIVKVLKEEKSAKKYGNRPQFTEMLKGFPVQYDGLLAYHPDRVARNMRDAGIIIDLLNPEKAQIKNMITQEAEGFLHGHKLKKMADNSVNIF